MNKQMVLYDQLHGLKKSELEFIVYRLSTANPLNTALIWSVMNHARGDLVCEIITAEIRQLKFWFDSSREYNAWSCTLVCEKLDMVFEVLEELKRNSNYLVAGKIHVEIINLLLYFLANSVEADADADVFLKRVFEELSLWDESEIPDAEKNELASIFNDQTLFKSLYDHGYDAAFIKAVSGWLLDGI